MPCVEFLKGVFDEVVCCLELVVEEEFNDGALRGDDDGCKVASYALDTFEICLGCASWQAEFPTVSFFLE
jgi:hypothetical protein